MKRNKHGDTPALVAAMRGHCTMMKMLLDIAQAKNDDKCTSFIKYIEERNADGLTLLHGAAQGGAECVAMVMELCGKNTMPQDVVDARDRFGRTPLHYVKNADTAKKLLLLNADTAIKDIDGRTAADSSDNDEVRSVLAAHDALRMAMADKAMNELLNSPVAVNGKKKKLRKATKVVVADCNVPVQPVSHIDSNFAGSNLAEHSSIIGAHDSHTHSNISVSNHSQNDALLDCKSQNLKQSDMAHDEDGWLHQKRKQNIHAAHALKSTLTHCVPDNDATKIEIDVPDTTRRDYSTNTIAEEKANKSLLESHTDTKMSITDDNLLESENAGSYSPIRNHENSDNLLNLLYRKYPVAQNLDIQLRHLLADDVSDLSLSQLQAVEEILQASLREVSEARFSFLVSNQAELALDVLKMRSEIAELRALQ